MSWNLPTGTTPQAQDLAYLAYIAGFIDGEGHIGFYRTKDTKTHMNISIANTNVDVLEYIQTTLKIGTLQKPKRPNKPNAKQIYYLRMRNNREALILLENVLPYLKVKRKQAELLTIWLKSRSKQNHGGIITERNLKGQIVKSTHTDCYTQAEINIVETIALLNKRGK